MRLRALPAAPAVPLPCRHSAARDAPCRDASTCLAPHVAQPGPVSMHYLLFAAGFAMISMIARCFGFCFSHVRTLFGFTVISSTFAVVGLGFAVDPNFAGAAAGCLDRSGCSSGSSRCSSGRCSSGRCCRSSSRFSRCSSSLPLFYALVPRTGSLFTGT